MAGRLKGKVTLITGAGMGMGREASVLFAEEGARVVVADINAKAAAETVDLVKTAGGQAVAVTGDVAVEADVQRMIEEGVGAFRGAARALQQCRRALERQGPRRAGDRRCPVGPRDGDQPQVGVLGDQARHPAPARGGRRLHHPGGLGVRAWPASRARRTPIPRPRAR